MYVVTVVFRVKPEHLDAFLPMMNANAATSTASEPGCRQFDVCQHSDNPSEIFLYELYDDRAAFDAHLASAHFKDFDAASADIIAEKIVRVYERL